MSEGKRRHLECKVVAGSIIQYGEPTQEAVEIASRGKVVVGGGTVSLSMRQEFSARLVNISGSINHNLRELLTDVRLVLAVVLQKSSLMGAQT